MKKLLIATTNKAKYQDIKNNLKGLKLKIIGLEDIGIKTIPVENGLTFKDNAVIKAKYYMKKSGLPTLSDDGGLEIDALGGEPGVNSHRWVYGSCESTDDELIEFTLRKMKGISPVKRGAQLRVVMALALPNEKIYTSQAKIRGIIAQKPSKASLRGYPYRSLFYIPEIKKFYDYNLFTKSEIQKYNHRKQALIIIESKIRKYLLTDN